MNNTDLIRQRLDKTARFCHYLRLIPFVQAILLNGSLAQGKSKDSSDIDLLIIVKKQRLYLARILTLLLGLLSGQKRSKSETKNHAGKFCFNYFLSDSYLKIPTGRGEQIDQYCADNYSNSILVWGKQKIYQNFLAVNKQLFSLSRHDSRINYPYPVGNSRLLKFKSIIEHTLSGKFGDFLEAKVKSIQFKLIDRDPRTSKYPGFIVCNDKEARFHPPKAQSGTGKL